MTDPIAQMKGFELVVDGRRLIAPCLEVTLYWQYAPLEHPREIVDAALGAIGDRLTHGLTRAMQRPGARTEKVDAYLQTALDRPRVGAMYDVDLQSCPMTNGVSADMFRLLFQPGDPLPEDATARAALVEDNRQLYEVEGGIFMPPVHTIRVTFPLDHPLVAPDALRDWIAGFAMVQDVSFVSGHVGFALNTDDAVGRTSQMLLRDQAKAAALARHPGLSYDNNGDVGRHLLKYWPGQPGFLPRIKRVAWLTLVNDLMLNELCGGRDTVEAALAEAGDVTAHPLPGGGLMIQAGAAPALGDVTKGDHLPAYRAVAKVLAPARLPSVKSLTKGFPNEAANAWLSALEDPVD